MQCRTSSANSSLEIWTRNPARFWLVFDLLSVTDDWRYRFELAKSMWLLAESVPNIDGYRTDIWMGKWFNDIIQLNNLLITHPYIADKFHSSVRMFHRCHRTNRCHPRAVLSDSIPPTGVPMWRRAQYRIWIFRTLSLIRQWHWPELGSITRGVKASVVSWRPNWSHTMWLMTTRLWKRISGVTLRTSFLAPHNTNNAFHFYTRTPV